jgi:hypothetical protein
LTGAQICFAPLHTESKDTTEKSDSQAAAAEDRDNDDDDDGDADADDNDVQKNNNVEKSVKGLSLRCVEIDLSQLIEINSQL